MTDLRLTLLGGAAASALLAATPVLAQTASQPAATAPAPAAAPANAGETVIVTGSRIRRSAENAPAPLIQVTQDDVLQSGEPNVIDFLADIPALSGSTVPEDTTGANLNDGGLSLLNLRDLGSQRTLVLVDGRRHVGAPQGSLSVDVDTIPRLLIQSTEIVTGGQSALYGADAVSGVVNFILKRNFEGVDIDMSFAEINQEGPYSRRVSALVGKNFFDDRLNVYATLEYDANDEVKDAEVDFRAAGWSLIAADADTGAAFPDDQIDTVLLSGLRNISRTRGGTLVIAGNPVPSPATDPDVPFLTCNIPGGNNTFLNNINGSSTACFAVDPRQNRTFVFGTDGRARPANFGTFQNQVGISRVLNQGGDGLNVGTEFAQGSRVGQSDAYRFQGGFNWNVNDAAQVFGEYKFVREETFDEGQPTFFNIGIGEPVAGRLPALLATSAFNIGLDNPYLDPAVVAAIRANTRPVYNAAGAVTSTVADQRALLTIFGPLRTQDNIREINRFVLGVRGGVDKLGFITDFSYDVGYTRGETKNTNFERGVDVVRFQHATDAVRDTAGVLGTANAIVCRVRLLVAQGAAVTNPFSGAAYTANDPNVRNCVPQSLFGVDMRVDGYNPAAEEYYNATIRVEHTNVQEHFQAFASGSLFDLWGAGPVGLAIGLESRTETTEGVGRDATTAGRFLFLNTGPDFAKAEYEANEIFAELNIPLFKDMWFGESAEISGAFRRSDYSTVGEVDTWSVQSQYRLNRSLLLRATYGEATRIPNLSETFAPGTQTFANGFVDPCDRAQVNAQPEPFRTNRINNCRATLGPNWSADPLTGTQIQYPSGIPGRNIGNRNLTPENSESITASVVFTPTFLPRFSAVFDYYDINITDVIASVTVQAAAVACVNANLVNDSACRTFTRNGFIAAGDPANFRVVDFIQGAINYAQLRTRGVDFAFRYGFDLPKMFNREMGELNFRLNGNYLIKGENFFNSADPSAKLASDSLLGEPRVRFNLNTSWQPNDKLRISWDWDWQTSQEIIDDTIQRADADARLPKYYETGDFSQHDISFRYMLNERLALRGGVVNVFDAEPARWLGSTTTNDNFDLFGRRFFIGLRYTQ